MADVAGPVATLDGIVLCRMRKRKAAIVKIRGTSTIVEIVMRDGDRNLEEEDCVQIRSDGALVHGVCRDTTSADLEIEGTVELGETTSTGLEVGVRVVLRMKTIKECFEEAQSQRCPEGVVKVDEGAQEPFASMGLTFQKVKPLTATWADLTDTYEQEYEYEHEYEIVNSVALPSQ